jgi:hypothetical protein
VELFGRTKLGSLLDGHVTHMLKSGQNSSIQRLTKQSVPAVTELEVGGRWIPAAMCKAGVTPEATQHYGAPWDVAMKTPACRMSTSQLPFLGVATSLTVCTGGLMVFLLPMQLMSDLSMSASDFMRYVDAKRMPDFIAWAEEHVLQAFLTVNQSIYVPFGWHYHVISTGDPATVPERDGTLTHFIVMPIFSSFLCRQVPVDVPHSLHKQWKLYADQGYERLSPVYHRIVTCMMDWLLVFTEQSGPSTAFATGLPPLVDVEVGAAARVAPAAPLSTDLLAEGLNGLLDGTSDSLSAAEKQVPGTSAADVAAVASASAGAVNAPEALGVGTSTSNEEEKSNVDDDGAD